jgi:serine phosphatase RsbU (regulator of sigma subunit)/anti-sigma regulatory factor (Ser/Thr protein kinase)
MTTTEAPWPSRPRAQVDTAPPVPPLPGAGIPLDIPAGDPFLDYLQNDGGVVDLERLSLDSPGVRALREAGVRLVLPLVSQGALVGMINLGDRLSEQDFSSDDRRLLGNLSTQAAPAVRVAQLIRQQQEEALERQRIEQELRVARLIQQLLLPKELPAIDGWDVAAYYQPARAVGGDFYDFYAFPDGRMGFVIGDVTDKGVPAALVMATTRTLLRSAAEHDSSPGRILERTNNQLVEDIPPKMFVTCFYAVLDPVTGRLVYANAGHDVPYQWTASGVVEMRARGMPLGLLPGMQYEEKETILGPGESLLLYSDGLAEAHNLQREMFGFPRIQRLVGEATDRAVLLPSLLADLSRFTGPGWEQEDDVTMVLLRSVQSVPGANGASAERTLARFELPSAPGNERLAMQRVAEAVEPLALPPAQLERLKTAVAEATMNAMEHGNRFQDDLPARVRVTSDGTTLAVAITDRGHGQPIPEAELPDLGAKLAGLQSPRGWGLFLIQNMVDEVHVETDETHHTLTLVLHLKEGTQHGQTE